eukprot:2972633-Prorocentrum_lima.AAC.1
MDADVISHVTVRTRGSAASPSVPELPSHPMASEVISPDAVRSSGSAASPPVPELRSQLSKATVSQIPADTGSVRDRGSAAASEVQSSSTIP